jgi:hypothetical protein
MQQHQSLDMQIDELLEDSSSNWFLQNAPVVEQNKLPIGIEFGIYLTVEI